MLDDFNREYGDPTPGVGVLEPRVRQSIETGDFNYLLGGEGPDGFAQVSFRKSIWLEESVAYLEEFYVVPDRRGEGTGRAIMESLFELARDRGASRIELVTGEDDTGARRLYEKFGFTNFVEGDGTSRALFYEINLDSGS